MAATKPGLEKLFAALAPAKVNYVMPYAPGAKEQIAQYAKTADVAILNGDLDDSILAGAKWWMRKLWSPPSRTVRSVAPGWTPSRWSLCPETAPLWDMENVIITPHCTPSLPDREARMLDYAGGRENAKNLCSPLTIK